MYQLGRRAYQQRHQRKPFHYDACPDIICSLFLRQIPSKPSPSSAGVVAGNTDILLAPPHRTNVCLSSATSSSFKNIQLTSSYISIYKDQRTNPNPTPLNLLTLTLTKITLTQPTSKRGGNFKFQEHSAYCLPPFFYKDQELTLTECCWTAQPSNLS